MFLIFNFLNFKENMQDPMEILILLIKKINLIINLKLLVNFIN